MNYHHGNNIGFLAGHVDGSMHNCYVYNGSFSLNDSGYNPIYTETQTGLIGEVGSDVENAIDPTADSGKGETGVMDLTGIYKLIRTNFTKGDKVRGGKESNAGNAASIISYSTKLVTSTAGLYTKYLRYDDFTPKEYIASASDIKGSMSSKIYESSRNFSVPDYTGTGINSVDFLWNQVVEEGSEIINGEEVQRGLGVFKIVSSYQNPTTPYLSYMTKGIGGSTIYNFQDDERITDVYYSTAEIDWDKEGVDNPWSDGFRPLKMTTLPSYSDLGTFRYPFSRDFNYVFHFDLSDPANTDLNKQYYMFNNNSAFLSNYLGNVLMGKDGLPVLKTKGIGLNEEFGFYLREKSDTALKFLQSYIIVGKPGEKKPYTLEDGLQRFYPPNSIVFHIDNPNGANVSVIGSRSDITVYSFDSINSSGGVTPKYTMRCHATGQENMHRFFEYNRSTGAVDRVAAPIAGMKEDENIVYAHIFKLTEPGDYVIGTASYEDKSARIFYLAVQGQNEADLGTTTTYISGSGIDDVDFLLDPPLTDGEYSDSTHSVDIANLNKAQMSFQAYFDNDEGTGTLSVESYLDDLGNEEVEDDRKCIKISFNDSSEFTAYLLANNKSLNPYFYLVSGSETRVFVSKSGKYPFAQ